MSKKLTAVISTSALFVTIMITGIIVSHAVEANRFNGLSPLTANAIVNAQADGTLNPNDVEWHQFAFETKSDATVHLTFTVDQANQAPFIGLTVHTQAEIDQWYAGQVSQLNGFGSLTTLTEADRLVWTGSIEANQTYYIRVANDSDFTIDYEIQLDFTTMPEIPVPELVTDDQLIPQAEIAAPALVLPGVDPNNPIRMAMAPRQMMLQEGQVGAGDEVWFEMDVAQINGPGRLPLNLTVFATPGDGNTVRELHLDLFSTRFADFWSANNPQPIREFGAGRVVERDGDYVTNELIWNGWVNNDEAVLVRFRNDNPFPVDYWMFTGDVIHNPAFAPLVEPKPVVNVIAGTDILNPLMLEPVNQGKLAPGESRWYEVMLSDLDPTTLERLELSMYVTPDDGNRRHKIGFELYSADQRALWSRDDVGAMTNFGAGALVSLDNNPETAEYLWEGHMIDENFNYIKIHNGSDVTIDFWLFTEERPNVSLGELAQ